MDGTHEIKEEANTSSNAPPIQRCPTPGRQALADSMNKWMTASVSKFRLGDPPTIYKVPQMIRQVKEVAYEPQTVSIGPYHHGKERLRDMEEHKWLYLHSFLSRNTNYKLEHYLEAMSEWEDEARSCYYNNVDLHLQVPVGNEFVKMMVLDACFIVEYLIQFNVFKQMWELRKGNEHLAQKQEVRGKNLKESSFQLTGFEDPKVLMSHAGYDMFLLENQIPFFVLQRIFMMVRPKNSTHTLAEMALDFFDQFMPRNKEIQIDQSEDSYCHLLHLFHSHLIPTPTHSKESNSTVESVPNKHLNLSCNLTVVECVPNKNLNLSCNLTVESVPNKFKNIQRILQSSNKAQSPISNNPPPGRMMIPCATELQLAGINFKKKEKEEYSSILDVEFSHNGVLKIPPLSIYDSSNALFRNLVAFEHCYPRATTEFTSYFWFMDCLVNTSNDVKLLHLNEIIDHGLGSDEDVALLFNSLCTELFYACEDSYLWDLHQNVQKHCKKKRNKWRASLMRDYFTNPWSFISLMAASILLLLTITQTFFTVFPRS